MSDTFFSYDGDAISSAAGRAAAMADDVVALVAAHGPLLATATGSLETVTALRQCADTWADRVGVLGADVRLASGRLADSLAGYQRIEVDIAAALHGVVPW